MEFSIGNEFSKKFIINEQIVNDFCHLTTDLNPIHLDEEYARNSLYGMRIVPGLLLSSFVGAVIGNDFPGKGTIYLSQNIRFVKPVYLNDTIVVKVKITTILPNNWLVLETTCLNQLDETVITGEAKVIPPLIAK